VTQTTQVCAVKAARNTANAPNQTTMCMGVSWSEHARRLPLGGAEPRQFLVSPSRCSTRPVIHISIARTCFWPTHHHFRHGPRTESAAAGHQRRVWSLQGPAARCRNPQPNIWGREPPTPVCPPVTGPVFAHHWYDEPLWSRCMCDKSLTTNHRFPPRPLLQDIFEHRSRCRMPPQTGACRCLWRRDLWLRFPRFADRRDL
jgi:hypothetical protein